MKRLLIGVALATSTCAVNAQWSDTGNPAVIPGTSFLGSINNAQLDVITNDIRRFTLLPDATYAIGGFPAQVKDGSLLLSRAVDTYYGSGGPGPLSLLHLAEDNAANTGPYRPWMRTGVAFTEGNLQGYLGPKEEQDFYTDMVLHWGGTKQKAQLRMVFTTEYDQMASAGCTSLEGLEFMRLNPAFDTEPYLGLGDWYAANLADPSTGEPSERVDVVNGHVRIRQLPTDPVSTSNEYVTVNTTTGVLEHRPLPPYATSGCEWNENAPANTLTTATAAVGTNPGCPELDWKIGIGTSTPNWKLQVEHNSNATPGFGGGLLMGLVVVAAQLWHKESEQM